MDTHREDKWLVVPLPPHLTYSEGQEVVAFLKDITAKGERNIILDASRLVYMDSHAIGFLLEMKKSMEALGGDVSIRDLRGEPWNVIQKTGLARLFDIEESEEQVIKEDLSLTYVSEPAGDAMVFHMGGMMYFPQDGERFGRALGQALETSGKIVLDLYDLRYMDSQSISHLLELQSKITAQDKELRFCRANDLLKDIFDRTGLAESIRLYETIDDALQQ